MGGVESTSSTIRVHSDPYVTGTASVRSTHPPLAKRSRNPARQADPFRSVVDQGVTQAEVLHGNKFVVARVDKRGRVYFVIPGQGRVARARIPKHVVDDLRQRLAKVDIVPTQTSVASTHRVNGRRRNRGRSTR